jgi:uncharacterized protein
MASRDVFVDTSGLHALIDKRDANHTAAAAAASKRIRAGCKLVVTDYVVDETVTLAKVRGGHHVALRVLELLEQSVAIRMEWIGAERFRATKMFLRRHADHDYSFTDCTSFVIMRELGLRQALTSDRHFEEAGFEVLLPVS